jgi:hypothetical protein
MKLED